MKPKFKAFMFAILTLLALPVVLVIIGYIFVNFLAPLFLLMGAGIIVWVLYLMWLEYFENRERFKIKKFE